MSHSGLGSLPSSSSSSSSWSAPSSSVPDHHLGIRAHLRSGPRFRGELKSRWSDFLVHEVSLSGEIAVLTPEVHRANADGLLDAWRETSAAATLAEQPGPTTAGPSTSSADPAAAEPPASSSSSSGVAPLERLQALAGAAALPLLVALAAGESSAPVRLPAPADKEDRRSLHRLVRACFPALDSTTSDGPGEKTVDVVRRGPAGGKKRPRDEEGGGGGGAGGAGAGAESVAVVGSVTWKGNRDWPPDAPRFVRFLLHKQNVDTPTAIRLLFRGGGGGMPAGSAGWAGLKDKRGCTTQFVTAHKTNPRRIVGAAAMLRGIAVGGFTLVADPLRPGDLSGNRFTVVVRALEAVGEGEEESRASASASASALAASSAPSVSSASSPPSPIAAVRAAMEAWQASSYRFVNYFGRQRFGNDRVGGRGTHDVGRAILGGRFADAVAIILAPRDGDPWELVEAKRLFLAGDARGALNRLRHSGPGGRGGGGRGRGGGGAGWGAPASFSYLERVIVDEVARKGGNFRGPGAAQEALIRLPPASRSLYVQAYQSVVWNTLVSERLRVHGDRVVAGDLVLVGGGDAARIEGGGEEEAEAAEAEAEGAAGQRRAAEEGGGGGASRAAGGAEGAGAAAPPSPSVLPEVRRLTDEDVATGAYALTDVVMPLPGFAVTYPGHSCGAAAAGALLAADGLLPASVSAAKDGGETAAAASPAAVADAAAAAAAVAIAAVFQPRDRRLHFPGGYRRIVVVAQKAEWTVLENAPPTADVCATDLDAIMRARRSEGGGGGTVAAWMTQAAAAGEAVAGATPAAPAVPQEEEAPTAPRHPALRVSFTLDKSCYATMALREAMGGEAVREC